MSHDPLALMLPAHAEAIRHATGALSLEEKRACTSRLRRLGLGAPERA